MSDLIRDKYRISCLIALKEHGSNYTYFFKNIIKSKSNIDVRTSHVLQNLKGLERDGYVKGELCGLGFHWSITKAGREYINSI